MENIFKSIFNATKGYFRNWLIASGVATAIWLLNFITFFGWMTGQRFLASLLAGFVLWPIRGIMFGIILWAIRMLLNTNKSFAEKVQPYLIVGKLHPKAKKDDPDKTLDLAILGTGNIIITAICFVAACFCFVCSKASAMFIVITWQQFTHVCSSLVSGIGIGFITVIVILFNLAYWSILVSSLRLINKDYRLTPSEFMMKYRAYLMVIALTALVVKLINIFYFGFTWSEVGWKTMFFVINVIIYLAIFGVARNAMMIINNLPTSSSPDSADGGSGSSGSNGGTGVGGGDGFR
jgi:hypothetical protein